MGGVIVNRNEWLLLFGIIILCAFVAYFTLFSPMGKQVGSFQSELKPFIEHSPPPKTNAQSELTPIPATCEQKGQEVEKQVINPYDYFDSTFSVCLKSEKAIRVEVDTYNKFHQSEKLVVQLQRPVKGVWQTVHSEVIYKKGKQAWKFVREKNTPLQRNVPYRLRIVNDNRHDVFIYSLEMEATP